MTTSQGLRSRAGGFTSGSTRPGLIERVRNVGQYRKVMRLLVHRDLKVRYAGSVLGYLWTILDPLLMSIVYYLVFTHIFHRTAKPFDPFMLYLITGQLPWFWFNSSVLSTMKALRSESAMVRSTPVPREVWVVRVILSKGMEYLFGLPVLIIFALLYMKAPTIDILLLPVGIGMEFLLLLGLGLLLAPLNVLFRDLDRVIPILMRVMFYSSPVLYSLESRQGIPKTFISVISYNPAVGWLSISRSMFWTDALNWTYIWHSAVGCAVLLALGIFVFTRLERQVLKEI